jgi:hypothetical protein
MDWPTTALLLGLVIPVTVALIKFLPPRNGERHRLHTELEVLKTRYEAFNREVDRLRREMETLCEKLDAVRSTVAEAGRTGKLRST